MIGVNVNILCRPPYSATNSAIGFIPLPTVPAGLPPLAEGPYSLPLMGPRYSNTCFQDPSQGRAWNCDAIMSQLTMYIRRRPSAADLATDLTAYSLDFTYNQSYTQESNVYTYGVQPPSLNDQQLQLVNDTFERSRGPAWALALPYNKTVILPEEFLTPTKNSSSDEVQRRMMFGFDFKRKGLAQTGEKRGFAHGQVHFSKSSSMLAKIIVSSTPCPLVAVRAHRVAHCLLNRPLHTIKTQEGDRTNMISHILTLLHNLRVHRRRRRHRQHQPSPRRHRQNQTTLVILHCQLPYSHLIRE